MTNIFGDGISWETFADEILEQTKGNTDKISFKYEDTKEIFDHIEKYVKFGKVIDCGCHIGRWSTLLKSRRFDYTGIDQSKKAIEIAKKYFSDTTFYNKFLWEITFNEEFDLGFCNNVLQHNILEEKNKILKCIYRALKPNGILFINESTVLSETKTQLTYKGWIRLMLKHNFIFLESWHKNNLGLNDSYLFKKQQDD